MNRIALLFPVALVLACGEVASTQIDATVETDAAAEATVSVTRTGNGAGTVSSSPAGIDCGTTCSGTFTEGASVTLTATPDAGSTFVGWSGGGCRGTGTCTVTASGTVDVTAGFALDNSLIVTLAGDGGGGVTSSPVGIDCGVDCSEAYATGTMVTLTATPDGTSTFTGWSNDCTGTGTCTVTMDAARMATATFTRNRYTLTVVPAGNGEGTVTSSPAGIDCGADCTEEIASGTQVTLTAAPSVGSVFTGWSGGGCTGTAPCTVTVSDATSVTATFTLTQHTLTVQKNGNGAGTVTSSPAGINCGATCMASYDHGTSVTLTAQSSTGSVFSGWSGGGCTGTGPCTVSMTAATTVTATFSLTQHTLTVQKSGNGTGTVTSSPAGINCGATCAANYNYGTSVTLTAATGNNSVFAGWSGAGCSGTGTCTVSMTAAQTVTAVFTSTCDSFSIADTTTIPGWTERTGDWVVDAQRIRHGATGGVYSHHITRNNSTQADGCVRLTAIYGPGPANVQAVGGVLRWTANDSYVVGLVQDNSSSGNFNQIYIYEYPNTTHLANMAGTFGTNPNIELCAVGATVTLRVDPDRNGTYDTSLQATTTRTAAGLAGVMTHTFGAQAFADDVCFGP